MTERKIKIPTKGERRIQELEEDLQKAKDEIAYLQERQMSTQDDLIFAIEAIGG